MHHLLNYLIKEHGIRNDAELAKRLSVKPPVISKLRHGSRPLSAKIILQIHEVFDMPVKQIKRIAYGE